MSEGTVTAPRSSSGPSSAPLAEVILRRALAFAPDDARILALLEEDAKPPQGSEEPR